MYKHIINRNFCPIVKGSTQKEKKFTLTDDNGPVDLTGASIKMQLKTQPDGPVEYEFSSTGISPEFVIDEDPLSGIFRMVEMVITINPFNYIYDLQIHLNSGVKLTPMRGFYPVEAEITYP